jgi:3-hydroxyisobutyrate dehydrogenase-like beta-hydroxyacid dehydrogenase
MRVAVIGLGEAGTLYASGFAARGWEVAGFDPADNITPPGVTRFAKVADAVAGADLVLSLTGGKAALPAAAALAPALPASALFADLNAGSAALKKKIAQVIATESGAAFADVSVVGSVPTHGAQTPLVVSGAGADRAAGYFASIGTPVENIAGAPGDASRRKLLRSSFMKGLGADRRIGGHRPRGRRGGVGARTDRERTGRRPPRRGSPAQRDRQTRGTAGRRGRCRGVAGR